MASLNNGFKVFTSPPPGSGPITASILKVFDHFDFRVDQILDADVYLKLLEALKFAFAQRSKIGDPDNNYNITFEEEIKKVNV